MANEITITKVDRLETLPPDHVLVKLHTETDPLVLKISIADGHKLKALLLGALPRLGPASGLQKL
jgi:hypothetical protein